MNLKFINFSINLVGIKLEKNSLSISTKLLNPNKQIKNKVRSNKVSIKIFVPNRIGMEINIPINAFLEFVSNKKYVINAKYERIIKLFFLFKKVKAENGHIVVNQNPA
tara:strand:- start:12 stop:335 length:324 start_codon:yes stop_codon:yes gene_type:complete